MEIINPFYLYLILQLDSITASLATASFLTAAAAVVMYAVAVMHSADDAYSWNRGEIPQRKEFRATLRKYSKRCAAAFALFFTTTTFLPSSERMAVLVVLPAVANNAAVQTEAKEVYELAKRGLAKLIDEEQPTKPDEDTSDE